MICTLTIETHTEDTWGLIKPAVLATVAHVLDRNPVSIIEHNRGCDIEMPLQRAVRAMEHLLRYNAKHFEHMPVRFNLEVFASEAQ